MRIKTEFYKDIETEFKLIIEREFLGSGASPITNLSNKIFYLAKHQFNSSDELDTVLVTEIASTLQNIEDNIVKKAITYQTLVRQQYNKKIDPQKWVDFATIEAEKLSFDMYEVDELKYLRNLHIIWLTWVFCDEELKKIRINSSRELYNQIGKVEKEYAAKKELDIKTNYNTNEKW